MVEISTEIVHKSLATVAASTVPNSYVYDNPNQQGTHLPAWFIVHREPVRIERENQRRAWIIFGIDLYYMIELNTPRVFDEYARVGDALDCALTYLQIYGTDKLVHVFERSWELAMNCLKYSLTLRLRCAPDIIEPPKMQVIEDLRVFLKDAGYFSRVTFICSQFPDIDMHIETMEHVPRGGSIVLPTVSGEYEIDGETWIPVRWDKGEFGVTYGPVNDAAVTINLIMQEVKDEGDGNETDIPSGNPNGNGGNQEISP